MPRMEYLEYRVTVGRNAEHALSRLHEMVAFHLESLVTEGKTIPRDVTDDEGPLRRIQRL